MLTSPNLPRAAVSTRPHTDANSGATAADPYVEPCRAAERLWVGLSPGPVVGQWTPDPLSLALLMSGPSQVQRLSGQDWVACIAVMGGGSAGRGTTVGYDSTAHDLLNPGPPLPMFAYCTPTVDNDEQVPCTRAHTAERFGWMARPGGVTEQDHRDCQALAQRLNGSTAQRLNGSPAHRLTGMPDTTAGGRLTVTVVDSGAAFDRQHALDCWLVTISPHQLTGPLLGLSTGPIPMT